MYVQAWLGLVWRPIAVAAGVEVTQTIHSFIGFIHTCMWYVYMCVCRRIWMQRQMAPLMQA